MFISAVIAGSFLPFSSEAVMMGLIAAGLEPIPLLIYATIGNWAGSMFNYWVGHLGKMEWIERYLHVGAGHGWGFSPSFPSSGQPFASFSD